MTTKDISFIIPVYNRPEELDELLESMFNLDGKLDFEVVVVEDGSKLSSKTVVDRFSSKLQISYYYKANSGPGDSRNYGMKRAKGEYFIILDSDCILPKTYLNAALKSLNSNFVDCFGGPDAAHQSFTPIQKAINFTMTSFITTGGIRGNTNSVDTFQPRSFNMGISKKAFQTSGGFGRIHPGEDPDLSIRLTKLGFKTKLFPDAYVYHKRRISWKKFYNQVNKFGLARPIINKWHPNTKKITYWFPTLFTLGLLVSLIVLFLGNSYLLIMYIFYFVIAFVISLFQTKSITVAILCQYAILIQFLGYGLGFLKASLLLLFNNQTPEKVLPKMFFQNKL